MITHCFYLVNGKSLTNLKRERYEKCKIIYMYDRICLFEDCTLIS